MFTKYSDKLPYLLAVVLYLVIYLIRFQQGGWEIEVNLFSDLRESFDQRVESLLPSPQAQLLSGILLGERKDLPGDFRVALRDTSTLHIVVVSGQNLTMLAGFLIGLAGILGRRVAILLTLVTVLGYVLLTGAQVPVLRAAVMATFAYLAQLLGRQRDGLWVLLTTGGLMLFINPLWIEDLSFQLSFLATFGVVVVAPILTKTFWILPEFLKQDLAVTLGAQLMVLPIIAQNFHQISYVGVFTNLLVLWTIPFIMVLGTVLLVLDIIWHGLAQLVSILVNILLTYFIQVVNFFASLEFAWGYISETFWLVWIGYYLILAAGLKLIWDYQYKKEIERHDRIR